MNRPDDMAVSSPGTAGVESPSLTPETSPDNVCPVCGATLVHEKCKVVCRSAKCVYRIIFNCSEF